MVPVNTGGSFDIFSDAGALQAVSSHSGGSQVTNWQMNRGTFLLKNPAKISLSRLPAPPVLKSTKPKQPNVSSRFHQADEAAQTKIFGGQVGASASIYRIYPPVEAAANQAKQNLSDIQKSVRLRKADHIFLHKF